MSQETHAREGAQAAIPEDEILDVAVVMPRGSTLSGVFGSVIGVEAGSAMGNTTAWGVAGGVLGRLGNSTRKGSYPSIVLAVSPTKLHVLGRTSTGLIGGWKHLHPVAHIDRKNLSVEQHRHGTVRIIALTDTTTDTTLEFEAQNIGGLGLKELLEALNEKES